MKKEVRQAKHLRPDSVENRFEDLIWILQQADLRVISSSIMKRKNRKYKWVQNMVDKGV